MRQYSPLIPAGIYDNFRKEPLQISIEVLINMSTNITEIQSLDNFQGMKFSHKLQTLALFAICKTTC